MEDWKKWLEEKLKDPAIKSVEVTGWDSSGYGYGRAAIPEFKITKFTVDDLVERLAEKKKKELNP